MSAKREFINDGRYSSVTDGGFSSDGTNFWEGEIEGTDDELFFVTSYSDFDKLAHGPRGTQAKHSIYVYRFHPSDGSMCLLNVFGDPKQVMNPAFSRLHPRLNVVYTCTEDIEHNGQIFAYKLDSDGAATQIGQIDAGGTSTCYLTIDKAQRNMLAVNYWDSTLAVIAISPETGEFTGGIHSLYDPKGGKGMVAAAKKDGGVNHSCNDESTVRMRQADPHSHAIVLDPYVGTVAYVPDLGKDLIREFYYDREGGQVAMELSIMPSGLCSGMPDGPRYLQFHPRFNIAYVVNELSSTIAVFLVDRTLINEIAVAAAKKEPMDRFTGRSTLTLIQSISTIPGAFPTSMNTCGRITVHKSGRFVVVSNRGHQSIGIFKVIGHGPHFGELRAVGYFHTRGETPRHFQFDSSGQYLIVANQDTDNIAVFNFNLSSGEIKYTGNEYRVPSPNFVCCCPIHGDDDGLLTPPATTMLGATVGNYDDAVRSPEESDLESESEGSTREANAQDKDENLPDELGEARREIEELKRQLASLLQSTV